MTIKHRIGGGRSRKMNGGNPNQNNHGAPYAGAGISGSSMGPNIRALGASGGSRSRRSYRLRGGNPNQNNRGAPYAGAGRSVGSGMGPTMAALGASGGKRKYRKSRRGKGGSIISAAAVPFGLLGLQEWFKGSFKHEKK